MLLIASVVAIIASAFYMGLNMAGVLEPSNSLLYSDGTPGSPALQFPVVDLSVLRVQPADPAEAAAQRTLIAEQIAAACTTHGFFLVRGAGFNASEHASIVGASKAFFALDGAAKRGVPSKSGGFTRGYIGVGGESGSHRLEVKEAFSYGYPWPEDKPPANKLSGPNLWPPASLFPGDPAWRSKLERFYKRACEISELVVHGLSLALGRDEGFLSQYTTEGDLISLMRLFHYFPYSKADSTSGLGAQQNSERIGSSPHTDWGFLTLILQDEVGGLQVHHDGRWVDVPVMPGTFVVNIGDYLSLLTGGRFVSPLHRVVTGSEERFSWVFFYYPTYDSKIAPLDGAEGQPDQGYSLFSNQQEGQHVRVPKPAAATDAAGKGAAADGDANSKAEAMRQLSQTAFGDWISAKWASVQRKPGARDTVSGLERSGTPPTPPS